MSNKSNKPKSKLPPINQQAKVEPTVDIGGKTFTHAEVLQIMSSGVNLNQIAKKHGFVAQDLRVANSIVKNYKDPATSGAPTSTPMTADQKLQHQLNVKALQNQKQLENLIVVMRKNLANEKSKASAAGFFGGMGSRVKATGLDFKIGGFEALLAESKKTPELLEDMMDLIKQQNKLQKDSLLMGKEKTKKAEEERIENERKAPVKGTGKAGPGNGLVDNTKKAADFAADLGGNLLGFLIDPKLFGTLITASLLRGGLSRVFKSRTAGLALSLINGAFNATVAAGEADNWGVDTATASVAGFLAGSAQGSMSNAFIQGTSMMAMGATAGMATGNPIGILAGALIGGALGVVTGLMGAEKLAKMMDESGIKLSSWFKENSLVLTSDEDLRASILGYQQTAADIRNAMNGDIEAIALLDNEIAAAAGRGDDALVANLTSKKTSLENNAFVLNEQRIVAEEQIRQKEAALQARTLEYWEITSAIIGYTEGVYKGIVNKNELVRNEFARITEQDANWWSDSENLNFLDKADIWVGQHARNTGDSVKASVGGFFGTIATDVANFEYDAKWITEGLDNILGGVKDWWNGVVTQFTSMFSDPAKLFRQMTGQEEPAPVVPQATSYEEAVATGATVYVENGLAIPTNPTLPAPVQDPAVPVAPAPPRRSRGAVSAAPAVPSNGFVPLDTKALVPNNEITTDFWVQKFLRDQEMKRRVETRKAVYSDLNQSTPGGQSQANPNIFAPVTNSSRNSVTNQSSTTINAPLSTSNQSFIGNF